MKILFIVLFWSLFFEIIPLIIYKDNLILYFTSVSFLSHYIEELDILEIKEIINDLIEKIESLNLSKKSILNQGGPNGPNDPEPELILGLLNIDNKKNTGLPEGYTVEDIFRYYRGLYGNYIKFWDVDPKQPASFKNLNYKFEGQELKIQKSTEYSPLMKEIYNISDISKKIEEHNKTVRDYSKSINVKSRGLNMYKGFFPDIYAYINVGFWSPTWSIDSIPPADFLYKQYYHLHAYTWEYNTLLLCKDYLNNEPLGSKKDLAEKSNNYWYLRQIYMAGYPDYISQYLNNEYLSYIWNPLNPEVYKDEVLENILFVGLRILEHHWTITHIKDHYGIDYVKNLSLKHEIIAFYNELHSDLKKEVYSENLKWYKLHKKIWKDRVVARKGSVPSFILNKYIKTPLSEETYHKNPKDLIKELREEIRDKELKKKWTNKNKLQYKFKTPKIKKPKIKFLHKSK